MCTSIDGRNLADHLIGEIVVSVVSLPSTVGNCAGLVSSGEIQNFYINQNVAKETTKTCCGTPSGTPTSNRESIFETEIIKTKA